MELPPAARGMLHCQHRPAYQHELQQNLASASFADAGTPQPAYDDHATREALAVGCRTKRTGDESEASMMRLLLLVKMLVIHASHTTLDTLVSTSVQVVND